MIATGADFCDAVMTTAMDSGVGMRKSSLRGGEGGAVGSGGWRGATGGGERRWARNASRNGRAAPTEG